MAARHPPGSRIAVVAGPGNNGGDGFVAARLLAERGYRVRVLLVGGRDRLRGDAALAAQRWQGPTAAAAPAALLPADAVIDALFGAGLDRPVEGVPRAMIEAMNAGPRVYAVDLPSGINGTTGAVMGVAVNAAETVTFFRRKLGHLLLPGRLHCGKIHVADIGIPAGVLGADRAAHMRQRAGALGRAHFRFRAPAGTNMRAGMRSWCPARSHRPGRRGSRRAERCGRAPASSPSPARARRSPSTRQATSPSWCARSMGHASSREFLCRRAAQRGGAGARRWRGR